ncbi:hypothetical protein [Ohtaekwangia sp.]|uniref:hypothetical protein n=1 Tax=Ohtaekwangia sp. TaxID=2066019 RepID=UPI002F94E402
MRRSGKNRVTTLAQEIAKVKVNKNLKEVDENSPFLKKKMEKGAKLLAVAGLPKI